MSQYTVACTDAGRVRLAEPSTGQAWDMSRPEARRLATWASLRAGMRLDLDGHFTDTDGSSIAILCPEPELVAFEAALLAAARQADEKLLQGSAA